MNLRVLSIPLVAAVVSAGAQMSAPGVPPPSVAASQVTTNSHVARFVAGPGDRLQGIVLRNGTFIALSPGLAQRIPSTVSKRASVQVAGDAYTFSGNRTIQARTITIAGVAYTDDGPMASVGPMAGGPAGAPPPPPPEPRGRRGAPRAPRPGDVQPPAGGPAGGPAPNGVMPPPPPPVDGAAPPPPPPAGPAGAPATNGVMPPPVNGAAPVPPPPAAGPAGAPAPNGAVPPPPPPPADGAVPPPAPAAGVTSMAPPVDGATVTPPLTQSR